MGSPIVSLRIVPNNQQNDPRVTGAQAASIIEDKGYPHARVNAVAEASPTDDRRREDLSQLMSEHPEIFDSQCRPMAGPPCHFRLVDNAQPVAMRGSRPVSVPLEPRLKAELDALERANIIRISTKPTAWVHPVVVVLNKNGRRPTGN